MGLQGRGPGTDPPQPGAESCGHPQAEPGAAGLRESLRDSQLQAQAAETDGLDTVPITLHPVETVEARPAAETGLPATLHRHQDEELVQCGESAGQLHYTQPLVPRRAGAGEHRGYPSRCYCLSDLNKSDF